MSLETVRKPDAVAAKAHCCQLKFIDIKPGKSGAISHAIIWNPHWVIRWHHGHKTPGMVEANFNALLDRALEIGATTAFTCVLSMTVTQNIFRVLILLRCKVLDLHLVTDTQIKQSMHIDH